MLTCEIVKKSYDKLQNMSGEVTPSYDKLHNTSKNYAELRKVMTSYEPLWQVMQSCKRTPAGRTLCNYFRPVCTFQEEGGRKENCA